MPIRRQTFRVCKELHGLGKVWVVRRNGNLLPPLKPKMKPMCGYTFVKNNNQFFAAFWTYYAHPTNRTLLQYVALQPTQSQQSGTNRLGSGISQF